MLRSYKETSATVADFTKKRDKQWIIPKGLSYKKTDERSKAKGKLLSAKTPRLSTISRIKKSRGVSEQARVPLWRNSLVKQRRPQLGES